MHVRVLVGTFALAAAALGGPTLLTSAATTRSLGSCHDIPIIGPVCDAIQYCWETDDPACQQAGNQPNGEQPQQRGNQSRS
jgi:hypothetical protein